MKEMKDVLKDIEVIIIQKRIKKLILIMKISYYPKTILI